MATREMERKALEKIRKIVADLGEDSYIGMAFAGAWELAESNIENDFGNSTQWYIDKYHEAKDKLADANGALLVKVRDLTAEAEYQKSEAEFAKKCLADRNADYGKMCSKVDDLRAELQAEKNKTAALQGEVIRLKAMLFDLMYGKEA